MSDDTTPFAWPMAEADYRRGLEVELHAMESQGKTDRADQIREAIAALPPPPAPSDAVDPVDTAAAERAAAHRNALQVELEAAEAQGKTGRADQIRAQLDTLAVADPPAGDDDATVPGAGPGDGGTPALTADDLEGLDVDALRAAGETAGLDVDRRLGADKLREDLARQLADRVTNAQNPTG